MSTVDRTEVVGVYQKPSASIARVYSSLNRIRLPQLIAYYNNRLWESNTVFLFIWWFTQVGEEESLLNS